MRTQNSAGGGGAVQMSQDADRIARCTPQQEPVRRLAADLHAGFAQCDDRHTADQHVHLGQVDRRSPFRGHVQLPVARAATTAARRPDGEPWPGPGPSPSAQQ